MALGEDHVALWLFDRLAEHLSKALELAGNAFFRDLDLKAGLINGDRHQVVRDPQHQHLESRNVSRKPIGPYGSTPDITTTGVAEEQD